MDFILLVTREGFGQDIVLPAVIGAAVLVWMLNTILNKWGYGLW